MTVLSDELQSKDKWLKEALADRKRNSLFRQTVVMDSPQSPFATINSSEYLTFCSNDYLGLATHPRLVKALHQSALDYGVGSGASHLVNGHTRIHQMLEEELADWLGYERVMLFSAGYMANIGAISALINKNDFIIQDKLNHASLLDGAKLSGGLLKRYLHNDVAAAHRILSGLDPSQKSLLVTDGVFSMDGDVAPLHELSLLAKENNALLMVDDAHGIGCCGIGGKGSMELRGVDASHVPLLVGTFGKAFGTSGAFIATSNDIADYLTQFARPYIYTTAMSPALAGATKESLDIIKSDEGVELRARLSENIKLLRAGIRELDIELCHSTTAIQPILVGSSEKALLLSDRLKKIGIWCTAIRPPTVPSGRARLRITLSAQHTYDQIQTLIQSLATAIEEKD